MTAAAVPACDANNTLEPSGLSGVLDRERVAPAAQRER
jgi:hypothetical protein